MLSGLLLRPPSASVLITVALRPHQPPERLSAAFERANRAETLTHIRLDPLTLDEASELLHGRADLVEMTVLYDESGGKPFYLEQLARSLDRRGGSGATSATLADGHRRAGRRRRSLGEELALVSADGRRVLRRGGGGRPIRAGAGSGGCGDIGGGDHRGNRRALAARPDSRQRRAAAVPLPAPAGAPRRLPVKRRRMEARRASAPGDAQGGCDRA